MKYVPMKAGEKYGCYTILGLSRKTTKQEYYDVQCHCGYKTTVTKSTLRKKPTQCRMCFGKKYSKMMAEKRNKMNGEIINGLQIIDSLPMKRKHESAKFLTKCTICGHESVKTLSEMKQKKGSRCKNCPPDYQFEIHDDYAIGHLEDGSEFKLDAEDIPLVSKYHWYKNGSGYIFRRDSKTRIPFRLHRYILGLSTGDSIVVDHINHDKCDNRKCNLRTVTQAENCMNNIKRCSNTIGHVGVRVERESDIYTARIQKEGHIYCLLRTPFIEEAAQAYNVAADYLFGVGIGYRNKVLYPAEEFVRAIIEKINILSENNFKGELICTNG